MVNMKRLSIFCKMIGMRHAAHLTLPCVSAFRLSFLCRPIRTASLLCSPIDILWMIYSRAMQVTTDSAAILAHTNIDINHTWRQRKFIITIQTYEFNGRTISRFNCRILAFRRAMFSSAVFKPTRYNFKTFTAVLAYSGYFSFHVYSMAQRWDGLS